MRTVQIPTLVEALEDPSGLGWSDPATGGATVLRWQIRWADLQNQILDLIDIIQEADYDAEYFGESEEHHDKFRWQMGRIDATLGMIASEARAAREVMR